MNIAKTLGLIICLAVTAACGGGGGGGGDGSGAQADAPPAYTLKVSGGTSNGGTGTAGLAVVATLRDSEGTGPGLAGGWTVTISGPGLAQPLSVPYQDGAGGSYEVWRWEGVNPVTGTYTATASDGSNTLTSPFTVDATSSIQQPPITKSGSTVSWTPISGAGCYYFTVADGGGSTVTSGYLVADSSATSYSFQLPALADGSYAMEVVAHAADLTRVGADATAAPSLPSRENVSFSTMSFVAAGGSSGSYDLTARGGVLYMGQDSGTDQHGLVVWTSLLTSTGTPPASDWTVSVTGPGISTPLTFSYPATDSHYAYWDFGVVPLAGTYTVTATASGSSDSLSAQFSVPAPAEQLAVVSGIGVTAGSNSYTVDWNAVPGAASYYVNVWGMAGGIYTEVAATWVNGSTYSAVIPKAGLTVGTQYDVYITASTLDMTTAQAVPPPSPAQVNMSDNTFAAASFTAQ